MSTDGPQTVALDVRGTPFPPYVTTPDAELRWNASTLVALAVSAQGEESGRPDPTFVFRAVRTIFRDPTFTTSTADEFAEDLASARAVGLVE